MKRQNAYGEDWVIGIVTIHAQNEKAARWQEIADARERQAQRRRASYYWLDTPGHDTSDTPPPVRPPKRGIPWLAAIVIAWVITLWVLYVLSCGVTLNERCWK